MRAAQINRAVKVSAVMEGARQGSVRIMEGKDTSVAKGAVREVPRKKEILAGPEVKPCRWMQPWGGEGHNGGGIIQTEEQRA